LIRIEQIIKYLFKNNRLEVSKMIILECWKGRAGRGNYLEMDFLKAPGDMPVISLNAA